MATCVNYLLAIAEYFNLLPIAKYFNFCNHIYFCIREYFDFDKIFPM